MIPPLQCPPAQGRLAKRSAKGIIIEAGRPIEYQSVHTCHAATLGNSCRINVSTGSMSLQSKCPRLTARWSNVRACSA